MKIIDMTCHEPSPSGSTTLRYKDSVYQRQLTQQRDWVHMVTLVVMQVSISFCSASSIQGILSVHNLIIRVSRNEP